MSGSLAVEAQAAPRCVQEEEKDRGGRGVFELK